MSASLVGSEMCIRDRPLPPVPLPASPLPPPLLLLPPPPLLLLWLWLRLWLWLCLPPPPPPLPDSGGDAPRYRLRIPACAKESNLNAEFMKWLRGPDTSKPAAIWHLPDSELQYRKNLLARTDCCAANDGSASSSEPAPDTHCPTPVVFRTWPSTLGNNACMQVLRYAYEFAGPKCFHRYKSGVSGTFSMETAAKC
eukprot:15478640-Alexandrium_andersonii.AAC.1